MEQKSKNNSTIRSCAIVGGIIIGIIIFLSVIGSALNSAGQKAQQAVSSNQSSTKTNTSGQTQAKKDFTKDEVVTLKDHEISITGVQENFNSGNPYSKPEKDDNMFVVVGVKIKNTSNKDLLFNSFGFTLEDGAGIKRNTTFFTGLDNSLESATLSPGAETTGNLGFEAKKDSSKLILHYSGNVSSGGEITINLK